MIRVEFKIGIFLCRVHFCQKWMQYARKHIPGKQIELNQLFVTNLDIIHEWKVEMKFLLQQQFSIIFDMKVLHGLLKVSAEKKDLSSSRKARGLASLQHRLKVKCFKHRQNTACAVCLSLDLTWFVKIFAFSHSPYGTYICVFSWLKYAHEHFRNNWQWFIFHFEFISCFLHSFALQRSHSHQCRLILMFLCKHLIIVVSYGI